MTLTLTQTASLTKKGFIFGSVSLILMILGWVGFGYYKAYQASKIPPPEEKPDVKFNILPQPNLKDSLTPSSDYTYDLVTKTGSLPTDLPKIMRVYFISKLGTTLLAPNRAKQLAEKFNFISGPEIISPTLYKFTNVTGGKIEIDLDIGNFNFERNIATESGETQDEVIADRGKLVEEFKNFLASKGLLSDQLRAGRTTVSYDGPSQKDSLSAQVTLWQDDIKEGEVSFPIVTAQFTKGLIKTKVTKYTQEENKYLNLDYIFWSIDENNFATYQIKSAADAYSELKEGRGVVVIKPPFTQVSISSVYLGYLVSEEYSPYLQPVFVFEGEEFAAIVAAITDEYLEKKVSTSN